MILNMKFRFAFSFHLFLNMAQAYYASLDGIKLQFNIPPLLQLFKKPPSFLLHAGGGEENVPGNAVCCSLFTVIIFLPLRRNSRNKYFMLLLSAHLIKMYRICAVNANETNKTRAPLSRRHTL